MLLGKMDLGGLMNSWAKLMNAGYKQGFEFWGFFNKMEVYKNGKLIATISSLKQLKTIIDKDNQNSPKVFHRPTDKYIS